MGTELGTRPDTTPAQIPGDFKRHPRTGAPWVTDPTKSRKRKGKKADLLAAAAAEGIEVPDKVTVDQLHELLGPEMGESQYGRPSSLGKQIENMTNLQKWSERAVALGCFLTPDMFAELAELEPEQLNLDDAQTRELLDTIAVHGKAAAQAGIAAERGTHTHALTEDIDLERDWIERARAGEDLGIPADAQRALIDAWEQMLEASGLEILAVEAAVVDDWWRQAGTLDRIARLGRDLSFVLPGGEKVTLPAGTVVVLDVKTGRLRADRGIVSYWHGYAVQVASYAQSVPYDVDTGQRSEWPWPIEQRWAIIAHLDVLAALDGHATCRLVLVSLDAGRDAGERCVWARQWERRTDIFSLVNDDDDTTVVVEVAAPSAPQAVDALESPAAEVEQHAETPSTAGVDGDAAPGSSCTPDPVLTFAEQIGNELPAIKQLLRADWPVDVAVPGKVRRGEATWSDDDLARVRAVYDEVTAPFDEADRVNRSEADPQRFAPTRVTPTPVTESPPDRDEVAALVATIGESSVRDIVNAWVRESYDAGANFDPRLGGATMRHLEITRAAFALAIVLDGAPHEDDHDDFVDLVRALLVHALDTDITAISAVPIGVTLAALSTDEARAVADIAHRARALEVQIAWSETGPVVAAA